MLYSHDFGSETSMTAIGDHIPSMVVGMLGLGVSRKGLEREIHSSELISIQYCEEWIEGEHDVFNKAHVVHRVSNFCPIK